jgi:aquaporin Z
MNRKWLAEFLGTAWLVIGGCGTAVLASHNVMWAGVSLAFGLTVLTMAYTIGPISGCHLNPAVTVGLAAAGRFPHRDVPGYIVSQVLGAILGAGTILVIAKGAEHGYDPSTGFAANGYGAHSPGGYGLVAALVTEVVMTAFFLLVILGTTAKSATPGFAGVAIGLALTLIHLISIPVTNTSVNPARSTSQAIFAGGEYLGQLWLFWVAPIVGAMLASVIWCGLGGAEEKKATAAASPKA